MKIVSVIISLFLVNTFQGVLGSYMSLPTIIIDLTLIAVVIYSISFGEEGGIIIGFFFGLFQDAFSGGIFGLNAFCKTLIGYIVGKTSKRLMLDSPITHFLIIFSTNILGGLVTILIITIFEIPSMGDIWRSLIPSAFVNGIIGVMVFQLVRRIPGKFREEKPLQEIH